MSSFESRSLAQRKQLLARKLRRLGLTVLRLPAELVERQLPVALQRIREAIGASTGVL